MEIHSSEKQEQVLKITLILVTKPQGSEKVNDRGVGRVELHLQHVQGSVAEELTLHISYIWGSPLLLSRLADYFNNTPMNV